MVTITGRILLLTCVIFCTGAYADDKRAHVNYMIHCQGCHLPEAVGVPGKVPRMKGFVGYFLHSEPGREFLIRVPGVSTSSLSDDRITELMNWLLETYSAAELPEDYQPFTVSEIAVLRTRPEPDPERTRESILAGIAENDPALDLSIANTN